MSVAIILTNLRAEGGPALAADLAAEWIDRRPVVLCFNDDAMEFASRFEALGVPIEVLGVSDVSPRSSFQITAKVASALKRHRASAIVSVPNGVHGAIFAGAKLAGVHRRVVHVGNYPWHWRPDFWKYRALMRLSAPLTPDLVCVTEHVAEGVKAHFGRVARRVHVIANGIDLNRFAFRGPPRAIAGRPIEIVMVARLDVGKDHAALIEAIQILVRGGVLLRLTIVGDGALRDEIKRRAAPLGQLVRFLGTRCDVPSILAAADVFAFAVRAEEGLGIALVEAMAAGLPVVASDVGACREVLDGGRCGALVEPGNPAALANALMVAGQQPNAAMTLAARARAEKVFSRAAMARAYGRLLGFQ
jgi:glycosyltransferase involved in cell wall biosynthesis